MNEAETYRAQLAEIRRICERANNGEFADRSELLARIAEAVAPQKFRLEWKYEARSATWMAGDEKNGCGVYEDDGKWSGNVVTDFDMIVGIGPFDDIEQAKEAATAEYVKQMARAR